LGGRPNGFSDERVPPMSGVPRLDAAALSASVRGAGKDAIATDAVLRHQVLRAMLVSGTAPPDWRAWTRAVAQMNVEIHGGSAGVADTAFFGLLDRYLKRTSPPAEARAAVEFLRGLAAWDFRAASW